MSIKKRHSISIALWETEMDVNVLISKPLLLKIEVHAALKNFNTVKPALLFYDPDNEKSKHWCAKATTLYRFLHSLDVSLEQVIKYLSKQLRGVILWCFTQCVST